MFYTNLSNLWLLSLTLCVCVRVCGEELLMYMCSYVMYLLCVLTMLLIKVCLYIIVLTVSFGTEEGAWEIQSLVSRKHHLVWASWEAAHCLHTWVCLWELYRVTGTMRERVCTRVYIYIMNMRPQRQKPEQVHIAWNRCTQSLALYRFSMWSSMLEGVGGGELSSQRNDLFSFLISFLSAVTCTKANKI